MDPDPTSYILPYAEAQAIFEAQIAPAELGDLASHHGHSKQIENPTSEAGAAAAARAPVAVFVLGQTGAGKTRTAPALQTALTALRRRGGSDDSGDDDDDDDAKPVVAHFIADTYKAYHPAYAQLVRAAANKEVPPGLPSAAAGPDARRWLAMAARRAAAHRRDVLLESACRHPGDFADLARAFRERAQEETKYEGEGGGGSGGTGSGSGSGSGSRYRIEVVLVAAPRALSLLGILARFYGRLPEAGSGRLPARLTPRRVHDESYAGLLDAAAFIDAEENNGLVDQVLVVRRDNWVAYANERKRSSSGSGGGEGSVWTRPGSAVDAIRAERRRPLTTGEEAAARADLQMLRGMRIPSLEAQLAEIEALLDPASEEYDGSAVFPPLTLWRLPTRYPSSREPGEEPSLRLGT